MRPPPPPPPQMKYRKCYKYIGYENIYDNINLYIIVHLVPEQK